MGGRTTSQSSDGRQSTARLCSGSGTAERAVIVVVNLPLDYQALFEATPTPFLILAPPDYRIVAVNHAYLRATLTERDAILDRELFSVFPDDPSDPAPTGTANLRTSLDRAVRTRQPDTMAVQRYPIRRKDGTFEERWWSPINTPVLSSADEVALVIHRVEDVTEIVRMRNEREAQNQLVRDQQALIDRLGAIELQLRSSEERFRIIADSSPVMMWVNDPQGRVEFVNRAYCDFFGVSEDDLRLRGWQPLLHPDDAQTYLADLMTALQGRRAFRGRTRVRRVDGAWRWLESYGAPRFSANGEFLGLVGSSPDITDIVEAAAALKDLDRRKDEFLALLAHELRNPLAPIRNGLEILTATGLTHPLQLKAQQMMQRQLKHLVRLVDDLLDVSRINRGKLEVRRERVALCSILDAAFEAVQTSIAEAEHRLEVSQPDREVFVDADSVRMTQVFANLLSNSARYTSRRGRIGVRVSTEGETARVQIEDDGSGLPADAIPTIFDLFSQVHSPLNRSSSGGLGLGLSLVKGLVEMHGGRVSAASAGPGLGSTFTVWLPLSKNISAPLHSQEEAEASDRACRRRILIVDDNRDAADSLASLLRILGHEVLQAHGGKEAIEAAQTFEPEFIFMDLGMPEMNGLEASTRIRQLKLRRQPFIVALTGFGQDADRRQTAAAGMDAHLVKPADLRHIESLLNISTAARH